VEVVGRKVSKYSVVLLVIVLIGTFLRLYQLSTQSIWVDEGFSVWISKMSVPLMVQVASGDVHPPLYYFLLHYWMMVFGTSASAVRLLSVLFGVLAIPMIYVVGRQLFNKEVGLVAALILALSSFNIYYSQETRMYSLMVLLALLSMYFFWRFLQQSNLVSSVGYVLSTTLLVYTHYYGLLVVIGQNIYVVTLLLLSKHRAYRLRDWAVLQAIVLTLFVPWMIILVKQILQRQALAASFALPAIATIAATFSSYSGSTALLALFLGLSVLSLFAYQKVRGAMDWKAPLKALQSYAWSLHIANVEPVYFLFVWLVFINIIPFIISVPYLARYTIAASVALYLLVAKGTGNINHRLTKVAVIGVIVVLSVANLQGYYSSITRPQAREATQLIDANYKSGDLVLIFPAWQPWTFDYYNNRTDIATKQLYSWVPPSGENVSREAIIKGLQSDVTGHDRVWFFFASSATEKNQENFTLNVLSILNESYAKSYVKNYYGYDVYLFEKRA
jgi:uncharacterized membrane protein